MGLSLILRNIYKNKVNYVLFTYVDLQTRIETAFQIWKQVKDKFNNRSIIPGNSLKTNICFKNNNLKYQLFEYVNEKQGLLAVKKIDKVIEMALLSFVPCYLFLCPC